MIHYIFAANAQHAAYCAKQNGLNFRATNVIYVHDVYQLYGVLKDGNVEFIFYETFKEHPQCVEILRHVRILEAVSDSFIPTLRDKEPKVQPNNSLWWKIVNLEPTALRGVITGGIGLIGAVGILVAPGLPDAILGFWVPMMSVLQIFITRPAVTANARVAVLVPDPVNNPQIVESGEAVTTATNKQIVDAAKESGPAE